MTVEPSDAVVFQDEYTNLLSGDAVEQVANHAYGVCEYLDHYRLVEDLPTAADGDALAYHGHCHQHAAGADHHAVGVLRRAGYDVDPLDSGCCGMAGSFGYEAEHYDISKQIGAELVGKVRESDAQQVVAPGGSCRSQLGDSDLADSPPPHPIELLEAALA